VLKAPSNSPSRGEKEKTPTAPSQKEEERVFPVILTFLRVIIFIFYKFSAYGSKMMLFFRPLSLWVKNDAENFNRFLLLKNCLILLHGQIKTETGNAGEQPVRDRFDLYKLQKGRIVIRAILFCNLVVLCLQKPVYKAFAIFSGHSCVVSQTVF
jgi:hypothetical protein